MPGNLNLSIRVMLLDPIAFNLPGQWLLSTQTLVETLNLQGAQPICAAMPQISAGHAHTLLMIRAGLGLLAR